MSAGHRLGQGDVWHKTSPAAPNQDRTALQSIPVALIGKNGHGSLGRAGPSASGIAGSRSRFMQHYSRSLWIIFGILLIDTMGFGIVIPILPKLVEHMLGGAVGRASAVYGLLLASFSLMSFLFSPV